SAESQISISMSAATFSGIGMIVAISSTLRKRFDQAISVVSFRLVSPPTQYAIGNADMMGNRTWFLDTGICRKRDSTADWSTAFPSMIRETSSGTSAWVSVRDVRLSKGTEYLLKGEVCWCRSPAVPHAGLLLTRF